jgi:hypothetical protein
MKNFFLPIVLLVSVNSFAQTNTFPASGNVGIGTLVPENSESWEKVLEVKGPDDAKILTSTNSIITGIWSHSLGFYGAPAGGITGTYTNHPYSFITNKLTRMSISANGNIGMGTTTPSDLLELDAANSRKGLTITSQGDADAYADIQLVVKDRSAISAGRPLGWAISHRKDGFFSDSDANGSSLEFFGINIGGGYFAPLSFKSNGDVVLVSNKNATGGNVGIGTTTPREKLSVNGNIRAKEIKVEATNWPDYVFDNGYNLQSLVELEKYLIENKHLPDMPSAKEIETAGQNLGQINSKLLKNVEELALHLIEKDKQVQQQQKTIDAQDQRIKKLEDSLIEILKKIKD